jgi:hypothetical protein
LPFLKLHFTPADHYLLYKHHSLPKKIKTYLDFSKGGSMSVRVDPDKELKKREKAERIKYLQLLALLPLCCLGAGIFVGCYTHTFWAGVIVSSPGFIAWIIIYIKGYKKS